MFGNSLMGGVFDNDPFFASHQQHMNAMLQNPFGMLGMPAMPGAAVPGQPLAIAAADPHSRQRDLAQRMERSREVMPRANPMDPFGMNSMFGGMDMFSGMNSMMANMQCQQMQGAMSNPNGQVFSQSSVMSYSNTGQGPPKFYQATTAKHQGPGGVVQTRKSVRDSEAAIEKMSVGRYIGDRGHLQEKVRHTRSGDMEENEELVNQDEEDLPGFNSEWRTKTHHSHPYSHDRRARLERPHQRALPDSRPRYNDHQHHQRDRSNLRQDQPGPAYSYRERD